MSKKKIFGAVQENKILIHVLELQFLQMQSDHHLYILFILWISRRDDVNTDSNINVMENIMINFWHVMICSIKLSCMILIAVFLRKNFILSHAPKIFLIQASINDSNILRLLIAQTSSVDTCTSRLSSKVNATLTIECVMLLMTQNNPSSPKVDATLKILSREQGFSLIAIRRLRLQPRLLSER
jgi:hypothetical protein